MDHQDATNVTAGTRAGQEATPSQETGAGGAVPAARLLLLERRVQAPFSPLLRGKLMERLSASVEAWSAEEIARVPDGTEPAVIFRALQIRTREERDAAR